MRPVALLIGVVWALAPAIAAADEAIDVRAAYETNVRHRLPAKITAVVDGAMTLYDLRALGRALPEMWRMLRDDPDLQALFANVAEQYKPRLDYSAYVGTVAETTQYVGAAVGVEADLAAPLCRYIGGAFNGHAYDDPLGAGFAWDTRVTGCLPWGPFAIELGFLSQRDVRVGLSAPPTTGAGRFDSLGFEMRLRGFRWLERHWELVTIPVEVTYVDVEPDIDDGRESASYTVHSAAVRFIRYGAGAGGQDRVVEGLPVRVVGNQDAVGEMLSARTVAVGAVAWEGARLSPSFFLDGNAMIQLGFVQVPVMGSEPEASVFTGAVDLGFHALAAGIHGIARYKRGLLPDDEFRLLAEDRGELTASFRTRTATWSGELFAAYTRTVETPDGVAPRVAAGTFGANVVYGRALFGPIYMTARAEAARSYYASAGEDVLLEPEVEVRGILGVAATWSTDGK